MSARIGSRCGQSSLEMGTRSLHRLSTAGHVRLPKENPPSQSTIAAEAKSTAENVKEWQDADMRKLESFASQTTTSGHASLAPRLSQWPSPADSHSAPINSALPQRVELRVKYTRRCTDCNHILSIPDSKAASTKFKIRTLAIEHVPLLYVELHQKDKCIVRVVNVVDADLYVAVTHGDDAERALLNETIPANPHPLDVCMPPEDDDYTLMPNTNQGKSSLVNCVRRCVQLAEECTRVLSSGNIGRATGH